MYGTVQKAATYGASRGYDGTVTVETLARASTFVDALGWAVMNGVPAPLFPGAPTDPDQENQWPRVGAVDKYGRELPSDTIPVGIERATYEAAFYEATSPGALNEAQRVDERVKREKYSDVEFEYAQGDATQGFSSTTPVIPAVMTHLAPFLGTGSAFGGTVVVA